jgi:predicted nucleic acid-binding protein
MTGYLLDTNVISEVLRPMPDTRVLDWCRVTPRGFLHLSVVSLREIRKGLTIMPGGARRSQLESAVAVLIPNWFAGRILPMSESITERWGVLEGQRKLMGRPLQVPDAQIAATALDRGLPLVTRNVRDFEALGLTILSPWDNRP